MRALDGAPSRGYGRFHSQGPIGQVRRGSRGGRSKVNLQQIQALLRECSRIDLQQLVDLNKDGRALLETEVPVTSIMKGDVAEDPLHV